MASFITIRARPADGVSLRYEQVRDALSKLTDEDLSASSPISAGGVEAGVTVEDGVATVAIDGHGGEWTKTSQKAVVSALSGIDGVEDVEVVDGGYETSEDDEPSEDSTDDDDSDD